MIYVAVVTPKSKNIVTFFHLWGCCNIKLRNIKECW